MIQTEKYDKVNQKINKNLTREVIRIKKLIALFLALVCVFGLSGCNQQNTTDPPKSNQPSTQTNNQTESETNTELEIVEIRDREKEENLVCGAALEKFFEDENNEYYFSVIKSQYVIVTYNDGKSEDIATALKAGRVTIADLDEFNIAYRVETKSN